MGYLGYEREEYNNPYPQIINVTVNKSTTSEDMKFLREVEREVEERLVASVHIKEDMKFECKIFSNFSLGFEKEFCAIFKINGEQLRADYNISDIELLRSENKRLTIAFGIRDAIAKVIAEQWLSKHFMEIDFGYGIGK